MAEPEYDVVAIGNAMVDIIVRTDDDVLRAHDMAKGAMTLVDAERADALYAIMPPAIERSGGSAGNTIAGVASLGGRAGYIGRVGDDQFGEVFRHDIHALGVAFDVPPAPGEPTGRCLIFVTPDAQRTMNTYLGAGALLGPRDLDVDLIAAARITYLEGYLWDPPDAKTAFLEAAEVAHAARRKVALTLSDSFCVDRHRESFLHLVEHHVDILFANESEVLSLYQVERFDDALQRARAHCDIAALTRSEKGSIVIAGDEVHVVEAERVGPVVDTTGAGDLYAAAFMHGLAIGRDFATCGRMGAIAAAEVISHVGARPETPLAELMRKML